MTVTRFQKVALGIAGVPALAIGGFILCAPLEFYAGYGITLDANASLMSELRAPGAGLAVLGGLMLAGILRADWAPVARMAAFTVYLGFPVGRLVSLLADGVPSGGVIAALGAEIAIAALCLWAFGPRPRQQWRLT